MPKLEYQTINFRGDSLSIIAMANSIAEEYAAQGYDLTGRQLYYQFVARDIIPNNQQSYKRLLSIVNDARLAGYIDWSHITDRTRNLQRQAHWDTPAGIIDSISRQFRVDLWEGQPTRVEVWVEKEALAGVVQRAAQQYDCAWFSCRGYVSQSEMWVAAQRLGGYISNGQQVVLVHLGDHDPSGIDMTRDITDRLNKFIYTDLANELGMDTAVEDPDWDYEKVEMQVSDEYLGELQEEQGGYVQPFEVKRIALNMDQILQYSPPPNFAKITDSRAKDYIERFGGQSWELDALDPATLNTLITDEIGTHIDWDLFEARSDLVTTGRELLVKASTRWADVVTLLEEADE